MLRIFLQTARSYGRQAGNPGLGRLAKELRDVGDVIEDPEGFGDIESDFMEVHKSHKQHEREMQQRRQQIKHFIVGNKYFKTQQPNFLTYAEKEQIKLLHARDPDEWTAEKLSESFPATPEIIERVIKAKWLAATVRRIEQHDKNVMKNWQKFNDAKCGELDPNLTEHLQKFAKRTPGDLRNMTAGTARSKLELPRPKRTEFLSIITESRKFRKTETPEIAAGSSDGVSQEAAGKAKQEKSLPAPPPIAGTEALEEDTYLIAEVHDKRPMRFRDLPRQHNAEIEQDQKLVAQHQVPNPPGTGAIQLAADDQSHDLQVNKFPSTEVEISYCDMVNQSSGVREQIPIPRHLWKQGYTYKLKDCYYADDGELLYRVPGMTGRTPTATD